MARDEDTQRLTLADEALINDPNFLRELVRTALQRFLEAEMTEHLGAGPHERTEDRSGHRMSMDTHLPALVSRDGCNACS